MDERRLRAGLARGFEKVQRAAGVGVEIIKRNGCGAIMARLRGGVDNRGGLHLPDQREHPGAVADVEFVVNEARKVLLQPALIPARVALRAEKDGALVVVEAMNLIAELARKMGADLRADQSRGAGDENGFRRHNGRKADSSGRRRQSQPAKPGLGPGAEPG